MSDLSAISPFFIVADIEKSVAFYVNKLRFKTLYMGPEGAPFYAMVGRDDIAIMLKSINDDVKPTPNSTRHEWARWDAFIFTKNPDALFEEFTSTGIAFHQPITVDDDGLRGFEIADADGYILFFGKPEAEIQI